MKQRGAQSRPWWPLLTLPESPRLKEKGWPLLFLKGLFQECPLPGNAKEQLAVQKWSLTKTLPIWSSESLQVTRRVSCTCLLDEEGAD